MQTRTLLLVGALSATLLPGRDPTPEQKQKIDAAIPKKAPAKPRKPRRMLVSSLTMRDGKPILGHSGTAIAPAGYAVEQMGKRTGAYEAVLSNDVEMFRPEKIKQFDAICFANTVGVLFEDAELKQSLLGFISGGKGFVGIHDAIATFVQYPKYDQWPAFGQMLGGTENGGHPWNGEKLVIRIDDPKNPVNAAFRGQSFEVVEQAFQLQEPSFRDRLRVLLSIDVDQTGLSPKRRILPQRKEDKDFPVSWIRAHGKGRVFYSTVGHFDYIYWNAPLLEHFLAGIQYALGDLKADDTPK
jgi:hypothetical protein